MHYGNIKCLKNNEKFQMFDTENPHILKLLKYFVRHIGSLFLFMGNVNIFWRHKKIVNVFWSHIAYGKQELRDQSMIFKNSTLWHFY